MDPASYVRHWISLVDRHDKIDLCTSEELWVESGGELIADGDIVFGGLIVIASV